MLPVCVLGSLQLQAAAAPAQRGAEALPSSGCNRGAARKIKGRRPSVPGSRWPCSWNAMMHWGSSLPGMHAFCLETHTLTACFWHRVPGGKPCTLLLPQALGRRRRCPRCCRAQHRRTRPVQHGHVTSLELHTRCECHACSTLRCSAGLLTSLVSRCPFASPGVATCKASLAAPAPHLM